MPTTVQRVIACMEEVLRNKGVDPPTLAASTKLNRQLGLDSLDYAELVIRLELEFGNDPFQDGHLPELRSVSDLAALYEPGTSHGQASRRS